MEDIVDIVVRLCYSTVAVAGVCFASFCCLYILYIITKAIING